MHQQRVEMLLWQEEDLRKENLATRSGKADQDPVLDQGLRVGTARKKVTRRLTVTHIRRN